MTISGLYNRFRPFVIYVSLRFPDGPHCRRKLFSVEVRDRVDELKRGDSHQSYARCPVLVGRGPANIHLDPFRQTIDLWDGVIKT